MEIRQADLRKILDITCKEAFSLMGIPRFSRKTKHAETYYTRFRDTRVLYKTVAVKKPEYILEIGTNYGHTTYGFKINSPESRIFTIDINKEMGIEVPQYQEVETLQREEVGVIFKGRNTDIVQIFGDSREISTYKELPDFDFVYIDGNHSFDAVISDTENVFGKTRQNAFIFWHDYKDDSLVETKIALREIVRRYNIQILHIENTLLAFTIKNGVFGFNTVRL